MATENCASLGQGKGIAGPTSLGQRKQKPCKFGSGIRDYRCQGKRSKRNVDKQNTTYRNYEMFVKLL